MRGYLLRLVLFGTFVGMSPVQADILKVTKNSPIPYLSWQDVKALYPPQRYPGDWDCPKVKNFPHRDELIERCKRDLKLSLKANPDPFEQHHSLPPGKLSLVCVSKDPENRIANFVFSYESELVNDLFVVYYYDPVQGRFILKSTR